MSSKILEESKEILNNNKTSNRHTFFQLKHFILGKELTTQSKLQKCLKELEARKDTMSNIILSIEEAKDDVQIMDLKIINLNKKKNQSDLEKQYRVIQERKLERKKNSLLNSIDGLIKKLKETEEEAEFFISAFKQLEKIEPLKRHDDPESNAHFWNEHLSQELQLRLLLQRPLDLELIKCILALNKDAPVRVETIKILDQIQNKALENQQGKITKND